MTGFVVIVEFRVKAGRRAEFRRLIDVNAVQSAQLEPGCRRFDVLEPERDEARIVLYEIYEDRAAFDAHLRSAHYAQFDKASAGMVESKSVMFCSLVCEGSSPVSR
jgi:(4S)-4-hydroxy-5-phosphonooxypentane-2,3-dione isomerase